MSHLDRKEVVERATSLLRIGLGLVFVIGGLAKLNLLLGTSAAHDGMVAQYLGSAGYINSLFQQYLFSGTSLLSPSVFLTALSFFELASGLAFIAGVFIRPLSLFYGFLLWTFVVALPTNTVPGVSLSVETYTAPAILVQMRDIALSGMMFVLFNLGAGKASLDRKWFPHQSDISWNTLGLLLRFSLGMVFIVAGFFGGFAHIANFASNHWLLALIGLVMIFGDAVLVRAAAAFAMGVFIWFMLHKLNFDKSALANLNSFKREFALLGAAAMLLMLGGGDAFTGRDLARRVAAYFSGAGRVAN
ncbi:MAG: DoxX family protein [Burkholderiales bacterium]|nr:DoxX family protein [Burkholderiales bacterium]